MADPLILYEARSPAVVLTLNRPDRRNALSRALITALGEAFERAANDSAARCVILTGAGSVFCAGMDLAELAESLAREVNAPGKRKPDSDSAIWDDATRLARLYDRIYALPKPTMYSIWESRCVLVK